jgi:hypothetical protein
MRICEQDANSTATTKLVFRVQNKVFSVAVSMWYQPSGRELKSLFNYPDISKYTNPFSSLHFQFKPDV